MLKYLISSRNFSILKNTTNFIGSINFINTKSIIYSYSKFAKNISESERDELKKKYSLYKKNKNLGNNSKGRVNRSKNIHIANKNVVVMDEAMSPTLKEELNKQVNYMTDVAKGKEFIESNQMDRINAINFLKNIDSSFEGFFFKREFNLNNFNYYIQVLSRQFKCNQFDGVLQKMHEMGIKPNLTTYTNLLTGYARAKDIQKCEEIFTLVKDKLQMRPNKFFYNSLMLAYAKNMKIQECDALAKEMKDQGLELDHVNYTTLLVAYKRAGLYSKCWDIYHDALANTVADEMMMSFMIRICAATHDSEKALKIHQAMEIKGFTYTVMNYNSLIFALSSKKKYAEKALEFFQKMKLSQVKPDLHTYVGVLRATSHLGDINTANDVIKEVKILGYKINEHICNGLLRTYAGASRIKYVKSEHLESYIKDAWEIFNYMESEKIPINIQILNALLEVHTANHKLEMVDGLVVPLFQKYDIKMNQFTYQHIFGMLIDLKKFDSIVKLYQQMINENIVPSQKILNILLESGMRINSSDMIVEALETITELKKEADPWLIRKLTSIKDLPDRIYAELKKNYLPYNFMTMERWKTFTPATFKNKDRTPIKSITRINNKRIKLK
jgi:pentatricopeptide repeat protein